MLSWKSTYIDDTGTRRTRITEPVSGDTEDTLYERHFKELFGDLTAHPLGSGQQIVSIRQ